MADSPSTSPFTLTVERAVANVRARAHEVGTHISTRLDAALEDARARAAESPRSALHGLPYSVKDEWESLALPTTAGSHRHRERRSAADSAVVRTFDAAGAVLLGKTNLSDMGIPPEATSYVGGACRNPFDPERTAGGSSGGSAAAVAYDMAAFDWGTDLGGSIRMPAAFCGVLGMRLSHETWPITDLFPLVPPSLQWMCGQGPLVKTTDQMRVVLEVAAHKLRTGTARLYEPTGAVLYAPDVPGEWPSFLDDVTPHVKAAVDGRVSTTPDLPPTTTVRNVYSSVWAAHFTELLDSDDTISFREGNRAVLSALLFRGRFGDRRFHPLTAKMLALIAIGSITIFRNREKALGRAHAIRDAFRETWERGDIVVSPVCVYPPPVIGRSLDNPHLLSCTMPQNIADATCLSVPFGRFGTLPRAIQLAGPPGSELELMAIADRLIASRDRAAQPVG